MGCLGCFAPYKNVCKSVSSDSHFLNVKPYRTLFDTPLSLSSRYPSHFHSRITMSRTTTERLQIIDGKWVDPTKLMRLCKTMYGEHNFHVQARPFHPAPLRASTDGIDGQLRLNRYKIYTSPELSSQDLTEVVNSMSRSDRKRWLKPRSRPKSTTADPRTQYDEDKGLENWKILVLNWRLCRYHRMTRTRTQ